MHICVLGAGIVGLATARRLQQDGHRVTVLDHAPAGSGASAANGAQLSYAYVQPLADPGLWRQLPHLLVSKDSPLTLRPRWSLDQWRWGLRFLAACNADASRRATAALLELAAESRAAFDELRQQESLDCDFSAHGKLVLYGSAQGFASAQRQMALQQSLGVEQRAVSADECVALEPALARSRAGIAGAIYTPGECAADCLKVCLALEALLLRDGASRVTASATAFCLEAGRAVALVTDAGPLEADAFVVALGAASPRLARSVGVYIPVQPLKGYSITLPLSDATEDAPLVNVTDADLKLVYARLGRRLRVAGMAELGSDGLDVPKDRIATLLAATKARFPQAVVDPTACQPWSGLRPATPTGLPLIGSHLRGPSNVLFNTGHGSLGFTFAFGSAARVAREVLRIS